MATMRPTACRALAGAVLVTIAAGCGAQADGESPQQNAPTSGEQELVNVLTPEEIEAGWRLLFDGRTTAGWRGYRASGMPDGWRILDGALTRVADGGDIITSDQFDDFELSLEWKVAEGGNSGVMFHVTEEGDYTYHTGPEMQVLDDARHADGSNPVTAAGSNFALHAPARKTVKPAGEWNEARLRVQDGRVEHWLNGEKIVEYELGSPDWEQRVAASKFNEFPLYGRAGEGHIALQDHGDWVAYRNIKIRSL